MSLIELIIAIAITGVILAPIGAAIYFGFRTTGDTQQMVSESSSANVMASYFTADVQGAIAAAKSTSDSISCGAAAGAADLVLDDRRVADDHDLVLPRDRRQRKRAVPADLCQRCADRRVARRHVALGDADLLL